MDNQYTSSISSFIRWAERKIEEEFENNKLIEKEQGTAECFAEHKRLPYNLNDKQKLELVNQVDQLRNDGMGNIQSCKEVGIHITTYCKYRLKLGMGKYQKNKS
jgi:predicted site-specific integrase-resolvase